MKKAKNFIRGIQEFMDSARGKTILNYLYSWGAAVVILGTLFKLTHIAGANLMLFVGMGTEVLVFFFSAFERPYEVAEEEKREENAMAGVTNAMGQPIIINGPIMTGGSMPAGNVAMNDIAAQPVQPVATATENQPAAVQNIAPQPAVINSTPFAGGVPVSGGLQTPKIENIEEMEKVTEEYIQQVTLLNEALQRISNQTEALGKNMQEMETLGRNLTGMNALYEVQLRSAGGQLDSIDKINEQTKKMAQQVEDLNILYARMIEAMTTNMNRPQI